MKVSDDSIGVLLIGAHYGACVLLTATALVVDATVVATTP